MSLPQVQVAHVMGKPTPKAPKNTGTPPLILRIPVSNDEQQKAEDKSIMKNITAQISVVSTFHEFVMTVTLSQILFMYYALTLLLKVQKAFHINFIIIL